MTKLFRTLKTIRKHFEPGLEEILVVAPRLGPDGGCDCVYVLSKVSGARQQYILNFYMECWANGKPFWDVIGQDIGSLRACLRKLRHELKTIYKGWL